MTSTYFNRQLAKLLILCTTLGPTFSAFAQSAVQYEFRKVVPQLMVTSTNNPDSGGTPPNGGGSAAGTLELSTSALTFTGVSVGYSSSQSVTVTNKGSSTISLTSIALPVSVEFSKSQTCGASLAPAATCLITVTFTPQVAGSVSNEVSITAGGAPELKITLAGLGLQGAISLSSPTIDFGGQALNQTSTVQNIVVTNQGTAPLTITGISVDINPEFFGQSNTCGTPIAVGSTCTISATFTPTASGTINGRILIANNSAVPFIVANLTGTGASGTLSAPANSDFGDIQKDAANVKKAVTLSNTGSAPLALSLPAITVSPGTFSYNAGASTCSTSLAVGASCIVYVNLNTASVGYLTGELSVNGQAIPLVANVVVGTVNVLSNIAMDATPITQSSSKTVTVTNSGNGILNITNVSLSGTNLPYSIASHTCTVPRGPGTSCSITLNFNPTSGGVQPTGTLTITSTGSSNPTRTATVNGTGQEGTLSIPNTNFGSLGVSIPGLIFSVNVTNTSPSFPAKTPTPSVTGTGYSLYSTTCLTHMGPGSACTVNILVQPQLGAMSGTVSMGSTSATLSATGVNPDTTLGLSITGLNYGSIAVGASSNRVVTLTNNSDSGTTLAVYTPSAPFVRAATTCTSNLGPRASCTVTIRFSPVSKVTSNSAFQMSWGPNSKTFTVTMTGTGS